MDGLTALKEANFDWVVRLDDVWRDSPYDVPELNAAIREDILYRCRQVGVNPKPNSPLGWVIVGPAGTGKTHLLSSVRRDRSGNTVFILVDMTDVRDFWETVLLGYLNSLREPEDLPQSRRIIEDLLKLLGVKQAKAEKNAAGLARQGAGALVRNTTKILKALGNKYRRGVIEHQDVVRAFFLLNSDDFMLNSYGFNWMQGVGIEPAEASKVGIRQARQDPIKILRGLSWLISLRGPVLLALDQLDAIVSEQYMLSHIDSAEEPSEEQKTAQAIVEGIGRGLIALPDHTQRTLTVVSCIESTWELLRKSVLQSVTDRYEQPKQVRPWPGVDKAIALVARRMAPVFRTAGFTPEYPTWPIRPEALEAAVGLTPREILKRCEAHRRNCLDQKEISELWSFDDADVPVVHMAAEDEFRKIDEILESLKGQVVPHNLLAEDSEEQLGQLLQIACRCLIRELPLPEEVDVLLETQFGGGQNYTPLHARLRLVYVNQGADEKHICFRALQKTHPNAYLARLKAATTFSGIDRKLSFRRLFIIRRNAPPTGPKCGEVTEAFQKSGGRFADLSDHDLSILWALKNMDQDPPAQFEEWLRDRRPVSKLDLMRQAVPELYHLGAMLEQAMIRPKPGLKLETTETIAAATLAGELKEAAPANADMEEEAEGTAEPAVLSPMMPLGVGSNGDVGAEPVTLPLNILPRHVMILAGSGAGRTVLLRRLIENAALLGLPSVVIDSSGELSRLGDPWPTPPESWSAEEAERAARYLNGSEVVVWTPGKAVGRPLTLPLLPDFRIGEDEKQAEVMDGLVEWALTNVQDIAAPGRSGKAKKMRSVLAAALKYFGTAGGGSLMKFINMLNELPGEASGDVRSAQKLAQEMATALKTRVQTDPLLDLQGPGTSPAELFGYNREGKTRISVINMLGLESTDIQQQFLGLLAMTLHTWARRARSGGNGQPVGLLAIDEARDYLSAANPAPCKTGLDRLVRQGGTLGLGLILATQNPKDLDYETLSRVGTWFCGPAKAPQSIRQIKKILQEKGGRADDLARLQPGQFYVTSEEMIVPPKKISIPMCLSYHPDQPLTEDEILSRAQH